jgi:hypothetical protein
VEYNREARLPWTVKEVDFASIHPQPLRAYMIQKSIQAPMIIKKVQDLIEQAQARRRANNTGVPRKFEVGQHVWRTARGLGSKLSPLFVGPFRILELMGQNVARIERLDPNYEGIRVEKVALSDLKLVVDTVERGGKVILPRDDRGVAVDVGELVIAEQQSDFTSVDPDVVVDEERMQLDLEGNVHERELEKVVAWNDPVAANTLGQKAQSTFSQISGNKRMHANDIKEVLNHRAGRAYGKEDVDYLINPRVGSPFWLRRVDIDSQALSKYNSEHGIQPRGRGKS